MFLRMWAGLTGKKRALQWLRQVINDGMVLVFVQRVQA